MDDSEKKIASIHLEAPTWLDRLVRKAKDQVFVVEFRHPKYREYGGYKQKRHQRRYADLAAASRRLDYLLVTNKCDKAYILNFPIDVAYYTEQAKRAGAVCLSCGGHEWQFDVKKKT